MASCQAIIRGLPEFPNVTEINIRTGPGTSYDVAFKAAVGLSGLDVLDAQPDAEGKGFEGKTYTWLELRFPDGQTGWGRDDLLEIEAGDCSQFGYPRTGVTTFAFSLTRVPGLARTTLPVEEQAEEKAAEPVAAEPAAAKPAVAVAPAEAAPAKAAEPPVAAAVEVPPDEVQPAGCIAYTVMRDGVNVRSGPGTSFDKVARLAHNTRLDVLEVQPEAGGAYQWLQVGWPGQTGWIREDLLRYAGQDCVPHNLGYQPDHYPAPMTAGGYWWVRGFTGPQPNHPGWDLGAVQGEPILAGPSGGRVITSFQASKATLSKPSVLDHGIALGSSSIFSDPGWGYGFGHYLVVRYLNEQLPASTQAELESIGRAGWHVFCMYAHLHTRSVEANVDLTPGQQIGTCGTTGNSEAPHLHLEIRIHRDANETSFGRMLTGLKDPVLLFNK